jgi:hypothetical protein
MNWKPAVLAVVVAAAGLTACDTGPDCVESHVETRVELRTHYVNGKPQMRPETVVRTVCDRYEPEEKKR